VVVVPVVAVAGQLVFVPLEILGPMKFWQTKEKSCFFVQGSLSHLFTLILFEPTRRGQTLGRWNVDPVYAAFLWTGFRAFRSYDLLGRRWSERHADFINLVIPVRWRTIEQVQCLDSHRCHTPKL
jgi:hypothetical protein